MNEPIQQAAEVVRIELAPEDKGKRVDVLLTDRIEDLSRTRIQSLIGEGRVRTNRGLVEKTGHKLRSEEWVEIELPPTLESAIQPEDIPIRIVHEDESIAVVYKPAGLPTHPTTLRTTGTLVNALLHCLDGLSDIGGVTRPGIVHRLDRVTSGLLVIAKTQQAHENLSDQFRDRTVSKTYRALCLGGDPEVKGKIEGKLSRHPNNRRRMRLGEAGRDSLTTYERIESAYPLHGLFLHPHTGRTHQIRIHMEKIGSPVVLDELYGYAPVRWPHPELNPALREHPGVFLHAEKLSFTHPASGESVEFEAAPPDIFLKVWNAVFGVG